MGNAQSFRLILASGSPARRDLLTQAGYAFEIQPSDIFEPDGIGVSDPRQFVQQLAWLKAGSVAGAFSNALILSADTVGWLDRQVIGKPTDETDALRILNLLSGREHELWTGVCLWRRPDDLQLAWQEKTRVFFKKLNCDEMSQYLATRQWRGCSGAYAIQLEADPYVKVVEGSVTNVIGLPMETLGRVLSGFAIE